MKPTEKALRYQQIQEIRKLERRGMSSPAKLERAKRSMAATHPNRKTTQQ